MVQQLNSYPIETVTVSDDSHTHYTVHGEVSLPCCIECRAV